MAIKAVAEIPLNDREKKESMRSMLRKDLNEAIDNGIKKFEIFGDYNKKYLQTYVREELKYIIRCKMANYSRMWKIKNIEEHERHFFVNLPKEDTFFRVHKYGEQVFVEMFIDDFEEKINKILEDALHEHRIYNKKKREESEGKL